jgi:uncharacterized protein YecE (DUF72 family)
MTAATPPVYHLGCPVWACPGWVGSLFSSTDRRKWLGEYSSVFSTVEGNSTFYGLPSLDTVKRWGESVQSGFQFCLKFPRAISHEKRLVDCQAETDAFIELLEILDRTGSLGPSFLQLPPTLGASEFEALADYLQDLPATFPWSVEVRHEDYFDRGPHESTLNNLLKTLRIDRTLFDTRPLFSRPPTDEIERESQRRKPKSPHRTTVTGPRPMLRLVGRNQISEADPWVAEWAPVIAEWIQSGLKPFIFAHSPDDTFAPEFASADYSELPDLNGLRVRLSDR